MTKKNILKIKYNRDVKKGNSITHPNQSQTYKATHRAFQNSSCFISSCFQNTSVNKYNKAAVT